MIRVLLKHCCQLQRLLPAVWAEGVHLGELEVSLCEGATLVKAGGREFA
jgi:hypothetical protein